jgi:hypothetical protein
MVFGSEPNVNDLVAELDAIKRAEPFYRRSIWAPRELRGPVHLQRPDKRVGYTICGLILSLPALAKEPPAGRPACIMCRTTLQRDEEQSA